MVFCFVQSGETALMWAAGKGHTDTCKALLDAGAHVNCQDTVSLNGLYVISRL